MNIIGKSECTAFQMAQYLIARNPNAKPWALEYAQLYLEEGETEGVRGDGAWIQSCKETGNFKFSGGTAVTFDQNNFCGLGVTRKGLKGHSFETPRLGIRAQIQHLKGYATTAPLVNPCIDPRYKYITKGCAPRFEDLAGRWAVPGYNTSLASSLEDAMNKGIGYGFDIIAGINAMKLLPKTDTTSKKEETNMGYTNSPLVSYTKISPNRNSPRNHIIDTITIHCVVGQVTVERLGEIFAPTSRQASCNYGIGKDGRIGMYCEEKDRSWCSSSDSNDNRAVTIEVASDTTAPYAVTDAALKSLIELCADICKRNNIKELKWQGNKALIGQVDKQNMTVHRWFANKSCPGDYLYNKHPYIVSEVNKRLGVIKPTSSTSAPSTSTLKAGDKLTLSSHNLYPSSVSTSTSTKRSGIYYVWNDQVVNGRIRITNAKSRVGVSGQVSGWVNVSDFITTSAPSTPQATTPSKTTLSGNYALIFNAVYYMNKYPDLKAAFGNNTTALRSHFDTYGMKEGRKGSPTFDVKVYKENNPDLQKAFGDASYVPYYQHYLTYGYKENRKVV